LKKVRPITDLRECSNIHQLMEEPMKSFSVSVDFEFCFSAFPLELSEVCHEIQRLRMELGPLIIQCLLRKIEEHAMENDISLLGAERKDYRHRRFETCLGKTNLNFLRVRPVAEKCRYAIKRYITLPRSRYTSDSLESAVSLLPHVSYRRSSTESRNLTGAGPTKSTLHRKVKEMGKSLYKHPVNEAGGYKYLFVDGTGVRLQDVVWKGVDRVRLFEQGELRMVYASRSLKEPVEVIGRWLSSSSWDEIACEVYKRIDAKDIIQLTTDGEDGIENAFMRPWMRFQRCTTHAWRSVKQSLYLDGIDKKERTRIQEQLYAIPVFNYAVKENLESLKMEDRDTIAKLLKKSENDLLQLKQTMEEKGYIKTAVYIDNLSNPLLTFLRSWLKDGTVNPTTNNIPENRFSLFKNRVRSIGKRWSDAGVLRIVDLIINKIFPGYDWDKFWKEIFPPTNRVKGYILAVR
jgi:hypothetical protein